MKRYSLLVLGLALALSSCVVSGRGRVHTTGHVGIHVVDREPPAPKVERVVVRPGFVWVKGRWAWQNNGWVWIDGRWERQRAGHAWREGRWERRDRQWHWVEGDWVVGGDVTVRDHRDPGPDVRDHRDHGPDVRDHRQPDHEVRDHRTGGDDYGEQEPPAPKPESAGTRAGHIWVSGRWEWKGGQWQWLAGHWERERANKRWVQGRWEKQGRRWVFIEGHWQ